MLAVSTGHFRPNAAISPDELSQEITKNGFSISQTLTQNFVCGDIFHRTIIQTLTAESH